ncbi:hypothetical protein [Acidimangrovimonas pyrenivorans]|uniref:Uncharacterized protein n=1 Tax=Acidimangrovimonas pyrenivorans TaxID=2030798 RepID=A0ABV7AEP3_9RHOB
MNPLWLTRMARWLRHPPSPARVRLVIGVGLACLALALFARYVYWPDWAVPNRIGRLPHVRLR